MDDGGIGVVVVGAVTETGDTVGDCDCFIGVSGQFAGVWQGFPEREDRHGNGGVNDNPEKLATAWVTWRVLNGVAVKAEMRATPVPEMTIVT